MGAGSGVGATRDEGREGREEAFEAEGGAAEGASERNAGGQREEAKKDWTIAMASEALER